MDIKPFIYGGIGSLVAELGTFPIDTAKTRLQIQGQTVGKNLSEKKYSGMVQVIYRISREEGALTLYNGIKPALLRQATYGTMTIGLYHGIKCRITPSDGETLTTNMVAGVVAGVISSGVANPTEVLKVRLQAQNVSSGTELGLIHGLRGIYRLEGLKGLFRGIVPGAQRAGILAGVHLPAYDFSKRCILESKIFPNGDCVWVHFIASFSTGLITCLVSNPIDVIKTRLMNQRNVPGCSQKYKSSLDCLSSTYRTEGAQALFKGLVPGFFRYGPWSVIFFVTYEQLRLLGETFLPT